MGGCPCPHPASPFNGIPLLHTVPSIGSCSQGAPSSFFACYCLCQYSMEQHKCTLCTIPCGAWGIVGSDHCSGSPEWVHGLESAPYSPNTSSPPLKSGSGTRPRSRHVMSHQNMICHKLEVSLSFIFLGCLSQLDRSSKLRSSTYQHELCYG